MRTMTLQQTTEPKKCEIKPETGTDDAAGEVILRRNNRGCYSDQFYDWPEQQFEEMDSPLAVQQYIQQLIRRDPSDVDEILRLPDGQDLGAWKTEHLRLFCMELNGLATRLQECCKPETCNQMTATEQWIFLCAAHKQPNECPAIDYTRHTLDGAASLLNSNKYFPSRVTIKESSVAKLGSVCRRVYRIFSHAYYHHFQVFDEFERETHLCKRFSKFVLLFELMSKDNLIVPPEGVNPTLGEIEADVQKKVDLSPKSISDLAARGIFTQNQQQEATDPDSCTSKLADLTIADAKGKKLGNEETSVDEPSMATPLNWTPSSVSTNTMVKGSSASASKINTEEAVKSMVEEEAANISPSSATKTPTRGANVSKNGLESEA